VWARWSPAEWEAIAAEHGTPFFVFDADFVRNRIRHVKRSFDGHVGVYYAVKSNPNLGLMRTVRDTADGVDISSGGELRQALDAGFAAERMSFAGPAKTHDELRAAAAAGVGCISAESFREIDACAQVAAQVGRPARIVLRVNPSQTHRAYGLKMGGRAVQFGIEESEVPRAESQVRAHGAHLQCLGLHCYVGSQCFDPAALVATTSLALRLAEDFERRTGWPCLKLNLGGGFGVAQSGDRRELDLQPAAAALADRLREFLARRPGCEAFFELGRFLTAEAGAYVVRVIDCKTSRDTDFATCDGGLNHQLAAAGTFGAALRGNFPLTNVSRPQAEPALVNICGPSCNPTDLLGIQVRVPAPAPGDLLAVSMSGSYGLTASPILFLGHDTPVELVVDRGQVIVGRRRHTLAEFN
jgi:diaminopimelate decarboxylase